MSNKAHKTSKIRIGSGFKYFPAANQTLSHFINKTGIDCSSKLSPSLLFKTFSDTFPCYSGGEW